LKVEIVDSLISTAGLIAAELERNPAMQVIGEAASGKGGLG